MSVFLEPSSMRAVWFSQNMGYAPLRITLYALKFNMIQHNGIED